MIVPCKSALQCALRRPSIIRTPYHASKLPDATNSMTLGLSSVASTRPGDVSVAKLCSVRMPGNAVRTCHAPSARERDLDMRVPLEGEEVKLVQGKIGSCHLSALCSVTSPWPTHPMALEEAFEQGLLGWVSWSRHGISARLPRLDPRLERRWVIPMRCFAIRARRGNS
jgi:hypothetical protein